jgi:DNA-binding GntR family transcriptional regulator
VQATRRDSVSVVVASLTELILTGQIAAGDHVIETEIAARLGVSRTPVREAIGQLVARGLLVKENNRSARVHRPSLNDLVEIYEMRQVLECHVVRKAVVSATPAQIQELQALEHRLRVGDEGNDEWFDTHAQFHHMIVRLAKKPRFYAAIDGLQNQAEPYVRIVTKLDSDQRGQVRHEHEALVKAIAAGDADAATEVTRVHLTSTVQRVTRIFEAAGHFLPVAGTSPTEGR